MTAARAGGFRRLAVLIAIGAVPLYLVFFGAAPHLRFIGYLMAVAVGLLFGPPSLRRWIRGGTWNTR